MSRFIVISFLIFLAFVVSPNQTFAETPLDVYMNDFYSKSNKASKHRLRPKSINQCPQLKHEPICIRI